MSDAGTVLEAFAADQRRRYPHGVFAVALEPADAGWRAVGEVLVPKQKQALFAALAEAGAGDVRDGITVLAETANTWRRVVAPVADLRAQPDGESTLVSQVAAGEWVKEIYAAPGHRFVMAEDAAAGWVTEAVLHLPGVDTSPWQTPGFEMGETVPAQTSFADLAAAARRLLKTPYRLGGRSPAAWDCSSFVQHVFHRTTGRLLPRHSWDQKAFGEPILRAEIAPGDLIYCLSRKTGRKHVGLYLGNDDVIHASYRQGMVAVWKLPVFEQLYQTVVIRRLIRFGG
jgi:cell wall-associated NlpC family hydrolase